MFSRFKRTAGSFALVLAAFVAYRCTLVPLVEPNFTQLTPDTGKPPPTVEEDTSYRRYFAADSWVNRVEPIVLDNDRSKLLFNEYHNLDPKTVQLTPCAVLFLPDGEPADDAAPRRSIVLDAPQGAVLKFDRPVDLKRGKIGQVIGGNMLGPVTITSPETKPGARDQIFFATRDVQMTLEQIWTKEPVEFQFGQSRGSGRQLLMRLAPSSGASRGFGAIESITLVEQVQMRLVPGQRGFLPLDNQAGREKTVAASSAAATGAAAAVQPPVDIRCQGPFNFDMLQYIATFQDHVTVLRSLPQGPTDRMDCERLSVFFAPKKKELAPASGDALKDRPATASNESAPSKGTPALEPRKIEARGAPVVVHGDINGVFAQAERLEYDIVTSRITLDGSQEVHLRQNANEIHARSVMYEPGPQGRLGLLLSAGPGWLRGLPGAAAPAASGPREAGSAGSHLQAAGQDGLRAPQNRAVLDLFAPDIDPHAKAAAPPSVFEAHWLSELKMRPDEQEHVISLKGDARAGMSGQGELAADEIYLWLSETPAAPKTSPNTDSRTATEATASKPPPIRWQIAADKLLASGSVNINSTQLTGRAGRLEAWFEQTAAALSPANPAIPPLGATALAAFPVAGPAQFNPLAPAAFSPGQSRSPFAPPRGEGAGVRGQNVALAPPRSQTPDSQPPTLPQYSVEGDLIRLQFVLPQSGAQVQDINIDGHVRFAETRTAQPGDKPLVISGEQLQVSKANLPETTAIVIGKPAEVGARGLQMFGDAVRLDKMANRLWIDGPGKMFVPDNPPGQRDKPAAQLTGAAPMAKSAFGGPPGASASRPAADQPPDEYMAPEDRAASVLHGPTPAAADPLVVTWQGRMNFDGATARFEKQIEGKNQQRTFSTDTLEVTLRHRIDFNQPRSDTRAELGRFVCRGETLLENRSFDELGKSGIDRMKLRDVMVDQVSGAILGQGPGWVVSVRKGSPDPTAAGGVKGPATQLPHQSATATAPIHTVANHKSADAHGAPPATPDAGGKKSGGKKKKSGRVTDANGPLNYLHVQFQGPISGNLNNHELTFHQDVRTIYGPVLSWNDQLDPDSTDELGPGDVQMTCDQLTIRDSADPRPPQQAGQPQGRRPIEMEAVGSTVVDVQAFTARCSRMTYSEAKDLLTFEGDGRNDAQLFRQEQPGAPSSKTAARTIQFWRTANRLRVDGARVIDLNQITTD